MQATISLSAKYALDPGDIAAVDFKPPNERGPADLLVRFKPEARSRTPKAVAFFGLDAEQVWGALPPTWKTL